MMEIVTGRVRGRMDEWMMDSWEEEEQPQLCPSLLILFNLSFFSCRMGY